jgi:thiamine-phosphate pyrophosphorylase
MDGCMSSNPDRNAWPKLYPILDANLLLARAVDIASFAKGLRAAGVEVLQYRNKQGSDAEIVRDAATLRAVFAGTTAQLILNDRADLVVQAGADGVHVGQQDIAPAAARSSVGPRRRVGVSTHTLEQIVAANATDCDYIAYGPVFATTTKENPDTVVGLEGLRAARHVTNKPLVAIGGIIRANCQAVMDAGADSIAVISDLFPPEDKAQALEMTVQQRAEQFLALLDGQGGLAARGQ